jgi:hypothetical protein
VLLLSSAGTALQSDLPIDVVSGGIVPLRPSAHMNVKSVCPISKTLRRQDMLHLVVLNTLVQMTDQRSVYPSVQVLDHILSPHGIFAHIKTEIGRSNITATSIGLCVCIYTQIWA